MKTLITLGITIILSAHAEAGQVGRASYYGNESGSRTASGEHFNPNGLTAAHRTFPLGTRVHVTNLANGKSVVVRINDRGPAAWTGRIIDLSKGAARALGFIKAGIAKVSISK